VPNISLRKKRTRKSPKSRKQTHGRHARGTHSGGLSHKDQRSLVLDACDEIDRICDMLRAAPMFAALAIMVRDVDQGMAPEKRDQIARVAKKHFDYDIDKLIEQPWEMEVINQLPDALTAAARWRLERLDKVLYRGLRGNRD
jgi:hypothetical protein